MNILDQSVIQFLNQFSHHSELFNQFIAALSGNQLLKGGVLSAAIWWLWFKQRKDQKQAHILLITTLIGSLIAVIVTRVLVLTLPFKPRPLFSDQVDFNAPFDHSKYGFESLSSFPSDHAALTLSLAFGIYFTSKRLGNLILIYSFIFILFPRVYLGLHYATDIMAGGAIGCSVIYLINKPWFTETISASIYKFSEKRPHMFFAFMFIFTYETSDLYLHVRNIARFCINVIN